MALALEDRAQKDDLMLGDTPKAAKRRHRLKSVAAGGRLWKHSTLADLDGLVTADEIPALFIFTLVRNPWARSVSYYHWLQRQSFDHTAVTLAKTLGFSEFLRHPQTQASFRASPARHYMTDATGVERASLYIRLEHFDADAAPLWDHLGFRLTLPQANVTGTGADYRRFYDESDSNLLAETCREDVERFGYQFDPA